MKKANDSRKKSIRLPLETGTKLKNAAKLSFTKRVKMTTKKSSTVLLTLKINQQLTNSTVNIKEVIRLLPQKENSRPSTRRSTRKRWTR